MKSISLLKTNPSQIKQHHSICWLVFSKGTCRRSYWSYCSITCGSL